MTLYNYISEIFFLNLYPSVLTGVELQVTRVEYVKLLEEYSNKHGVMFDLSRALAESPVEVMFPQGRKIIFRIID